MNTYLKVFLALLVLAISPVAYAEDPEEELKITMLEALISAPPERAMPIVKKVLAGDGSDELKERALFVLSQIDEAEAQQMIADLAKNASGELRLEAIRMIGIGGNDAAIAGLRDIYSAGDKDVREAVLEAYLIAGDVQSVYEIATNTTDPDEFDDAVQMLGAMGALDELRQLRAKAGMSEALIEAYAMAGDAESLRELALDSSDPEMQADAVLALGIVGGDEVNAMLVSIFTSSDSEDVREAALEGMLISGHTEGVLELYRQSDDPEEKQQLLEMLVVMDSEAVWDIIDAALEDGS